MTFRSKVTVIKPSSIARSTAARANDTETRLKQEYFFLNRYRAFESFFCLVTKPGGSGRAARTVGRRGNERPGRYSGTVELNSVTRSATPDEMYRRFFPVNPITSSNDRGCSSGLSYERQDRGREERRRERKRENSTQLGKRGERKET